MTVAEDSPAQARGEGLRAAGRWLAHPVSLAAIVVMVVNDHILKAEFGTWWTGKLSDVAGLVFFPALLAGAVALVLPRLRPDAVATLALVVTGLGFTWVKATEVGASTASALLSALAGPSIVLKDATDVVALASLTLAAWVAMRARVPGSSSRRDRWHATVVAPVALLASVATSSPSGTGRLDTIADALDLARTAVLATYATERSAEVTSSAVGVTGAASSSVD